MIAARHGAASGPRGWRARESGPASAASSRALLGSSLQGAERVPRLDTTTPSDKAMFGMLGVFAEFEWAMIQERVKAGMTRARAEVGRPKMAAEFEQSIR